MKTTNQIHIHRKQSILKLQQFELPKKELKYLKGRGEIIITDIVDV